MIKLSTSEKRRLEVSLSSINEGLDKLNRKKANLLKQLGIKDEPVAQSTSIPKKGETFKNGVVEGVYVKIIPTNSDGTPSKVTRYLSIEEA